MYDYKNYYGKYESIRSKVNNAANTAIRHNVSNNICSNLNNSLIIMNNIINSLADEQNDSAISNFVKNLISQKKTIQLIQDFLSSNYSDAEQVYQYLKNNLDALEKSDKSLKHICENKPRQSDYLTETGEIDTYTYNIKLKKWQLKVYSLKSDCKNISNNIDEYLSYLDSINCCIPEEGKVNIQIPTKSFANLNFDIANKILDIASAFTVKFNISPMIKSRGADPWVMFKDGYYYYTDTDVSANARDIVIYRTKDLSNLDSAERVYQFNQPSDKGGIWAPELHNINDKWYIYYTDGDPKKSAGDKNRRMFVLESKDSNLTDGFGNPKMIEAPKSEGRYAIDGTPLEWNGEMYMIWSGREAEGDSNNDQSLYIAHMSDPTTIDGERKRISLPQYDWEKGTNGHNVNEGPQVLVKDDQLHIIYSASPAYKDKYCLGMLTYDGKGDIEDIESWQKNSEPVFKSGNGVVAPGHCSFVKSPDGTEDWIVYHARSNPNENWDKRNVRMQKFTWNGTNPVFGEPLSNDSVQVAPSGTPLPEYMTAQSLGEATVNANSLNLRDSANGALIGSFSNGEKVDIIGEPENGWVRVKSGEKVGYVSAQYLSNYENV